ncbi:MAG: NEW3 domain-containing protein [Clostridium sp.]|nr:NEW3 domain-containing protein [Clostridium sp.]
MEETVAIRRNRIRVRRGLLAVFGVAAFLLLMNVHTAYGAGGLKLNTDYPGISVKPGDNLNIPVSLENHTGGSLDADVEVTSMPQGWEGYLQGGSYQISRIHVKSGEEGGTMTLHVTVPKELTEGNYRVEVKARAGEGISDTLPITFMVNETKAGKGSFTSEYPQQEGTAGTNFSFSTTLLNNGLKQESYSLSSNAPAGWSVSFTPTGETAKVAAIEVESGAGKGMTVSVTPPEGVAAGEYHISCSAVSAKETLSTDLKVVITGSYGLAISTPDDRLSFDAYPGRTSDVTLTVNNTGNVDLENVSLNAALPTGWTVSYNMDNNLIASVPAGGSVEVVAHVKPGSEAITGDYVNSFTAKCDQTQGSADFRVSVKTETVWGFVAAAIILFTGGGLAYVFRKYGRR